MAKAKFEVKIKNDRGGEITLKASDFDFPNKEDEEQVFYFKTEDGYVPCEGSDLISISRIQEVRYDVEFHDNRGTLVVDSWDDLLPQDMIRVFIGVMHIDINHSLIKSIKKQV